MRKLRIALVGVLAAGALYTVGPSTATAAPTQAPLGVAQAKGGSAAHVPGGTATDLPLRALARKHGLGIGTAIDMNALETDAPYRERAAREFSAVTAENVMKWAELEPTRGQYNWGPADKLVEFARRNGQKVHGHTLLWHSQAPAWLTEGVADGSIDSAELRDIVRNHVTTVVKHFRGKVRAWDVVNEAFTDGDAPVLRDTIFRQHLGPDYIADALRWAHAADPRAKLFLNDYAIDNVNPKSTAYYELAKQLRKQRVPLHGMGFQGHLDLQYPLPIDAPQNLARFDKLGLETAFTEVDVRFFLPVDTYKEAGQVGSFNTLLTACLLTPRCVMFTVWGFTDKYSWVPGFFDGQGSATPLDENLQPKAAYRGLQQVLAVASDPNSRRGF
ncbi:endo-1,4-beta-xylanase [Plantactinospora sp. KLBMP9567]|uniref:endo-1,4-beta-xylanase n=1 Tax=Plantactinospora sp. KLBMP9567 TaxID=3085900 RepID=UPI00298134AF|nr:endo-1,4-beta-xylanase [Plantactinospora sp. KLBMP9567]MDW5327590.1 endo-1,4-beta-xylanase [Plantactinospora sp. KLBMP9567]